MSADSHTKERLIRVVDEHWMIYVRPLIFSVLVFVAGVSIFVFYVNSNFEDAWMNVTVFLFGFFTLVLSLHGIFLVLLNESISQFVITDRRLVHFDDALPFTESMLEVNFEKMKTVEVEKHGILQYTFNYGTLLFETNKAKVHYVPHPNSVARDIHQAMGML